MSKPVTSVAVMMLLEEGKIDLMDDVAKFIPEFRNPKYCTKDGRILSSAKPVTIQDLLNMTSGLTYGGCSNENEKQTRLAQVYELAPHKKCHIFRTLMSCRLINKKQFFRLQVHQEFLL
jgi:CubicO group peptidase (beta-lactamase class C family)